MAVDANVLIFERIREEIRNGNSPQTSIHAGYEKAFSTITDANITTLIAALVLFSFGTGPIKGFAVTLSLGIICSMFTAIMVTRGLVNLTYGGRKLDKLRI
jgi:preprotein translocase subunit SecD